MKLLAIIGSPRLKGNTDYLTGQALEEATKLGVETEKIILSQYKVGPCLGHDDCASFDTCVQKDDAAWILERLCEADGVILATPVYYYNASAQLKAFIDRNYFLYTHDRKAKAKAIGILMVAEAAGLEDTLHTLKRYIGEAFTVDKSRIFTMGGIAGRLGEAQNNTLLIKEARKLGNQITMSLKEQS